MNARSDNEFDDCIKLGHELYNKRKSDSFFSGGEQTEGGGEDNQYVDDYRLQAIIEKIQT